MEREIINPVTLSALEEAGKLAQEWQKDNAEKIKVQSMPRSSIMMRAFRDDWDRLSDGGTYDMKALKKAMAHLVVNDSPLAGETECDGFRLYSIEDDLLMMYKIFDGNADDLVIFIRAGSHSELF